MVQNKKMLPHVEILVRRIHEFVHILHIPLGSRSELKGIGGGGQEKKLFAFRNSESSVAENTRVAAEACISQVGPMRKAARGGAHRASVLEATVCVLDGAATAAAGSRGASRLVGVNIKHLAGPV